ncbi:MAG: Zn-dependent hydrolase of the beta-lactamase fold [Fibrobacteres bacterium]|nr:Zn-dependent hydrolase of the beta-lactamase fold [Fibrobacterota bacterium]
MLFRDPRSGSITAAARIGPRRFFRYPNPIEASMRVASAPSVEFQILSHAGLLVKGAGKSLIFDPWLVGSSYWRSWWNFPPVSRELIESLRPDFLYLTHIHWDHFHGPSLRKFPLDTPIFIPKSPARRMKKDLLAMGFENVTEIRHGQTVELAPGLRLSSYQFYPFMDSAAVVECGGVTLFNANDAKFMGAPLDQILARHPRIDFVFRSHSSANERMCFDFMDEPARPREDSRRYLRDFADFVRKVGARYAIPFASNHCYLHRETFHLNDTITTPPQVEAYCRSRDMTHPEVKAMVSGDAWSSQTGFAIAKGPHFTDRDRCLEAYAAGQSQVLEKFYALEARTDTSLAQVEGYFRRFIAVLPWVVRRAFKDRQVTCVLSGKRTSRFWIDIHRGVIREVAGVDDEANPLQIYTSAYVFRRCMAQDMFIHLGISKRVLFRSSKADAKYFRLLITLFNLYECEMLPAWKLLSPRFLAAWLPRWREVGLYMVILCRQALGRPFSMGDYLKGDPAGQEGEKRPREVRWPVLITQKRL